MVGEVHPVGRVIPPQSTYQSAGEELYRSGWASASPSFGARYACPAQSTQSTDDRYGSGIGVSRPSGVEATNYWGPGSVPGAGVERAYSTPDTRSSQGFRGGGSASHDTGPPDPSWMDQLAERLGPMIAQEVSRQLHPERERYTPGIVNPLASTTFAPHTGSFASANFPIDLDPVSDYSDTDSEGSSEEVEVVGEAQPGFPPSHAEDDAPRGTVLPQALVDRIVDIFVTRLGYDRPVVTPSVVSESRLSATNELLPGEVASTVPVDAQCLARFEQLASGPWTAAPKERPFKVSKESKAALFTVPSFSEPTVQRARAEQGIAKGVFKDPVRVDSEKAWSQADQASRMGLQSSSVFLLVAEVLQRALVQQPGSPDSIPPEEVGSLVSILGPLSRLIFDQFARISLKATEQRRTNLLDVFKWPTAEARGSLQRLPVSGSDLFHGEFIKTLTEEVTKHKESFNASFMLPPKPGPSTSTPKAARKGQQGSRPRKPKKRAHSGGQGSRGGQATRGGTGHKRSRGFSSRGRFPP